MDSLKENHLGTLILLVISLSGLTFYAIAETIHRQPWGTLCAFLGFGAFVCFMCLMPLLHRRISLYRIGRDLETQRSQESFSLDQSKSTSLIDITCRLQTCRKRTNIHLIATSALAVSLIGGTVFAYQQGEIATIQQEAKQRIQQAEEAKQADRAKILEEIELQRIAMQSKIEKSLMAHLTATQLDRTERIFIEVKQCKEHPNKCYRQEGNGGSYLLKDYDTILNNYRKHLFTLTASQLDMLTQQCLDSLPNDYQSIQSLISDLQKEWLEKTDKHFYDIYHAGYFQSTYKFTPFIKYLDSSKLKDEKLREVISLMWYVQATGREFEHYYSTKIASLKEPNASLSFTSAFKADMDSKYKEEAVQVRQEENQEEIKDAMLKDLEARRVQMQETLTINLINNLSTNFDKTELIAQHIKTCKEKPNRCFRLSEQGESHINSNYTVLESEYTKQLYLLRLYNFDTLIQADNNIPDNLRPTLRYTWLQDVDQFFYTLYQSKEFQKSFKTSEPIKYLNSAHIKDKNLREVIAQMLFLDSLTKEIKAYIAPLQKANPAQNIFPKTPYKSVFKRELDSKYKKEDFDGSKAVHISVL